LILQLFTTLNFTRQIAIKKIVTSQQSRHASASWSSPTLIANKIKRWMPACAGMTAATLGLIKLKGSKIATIENLA
jgi:hypothetical protein